MTGADAATGREDALGTRRFERRHLRFGWGALFVFLLLGMTLEVMHGLKIGWYLDVSNETRRLMWRLAHAHGVLLGLVNVAYAATLRIGVAPSTLASRSLVGATLLLPSGFLLGGVVVHGGDPSLGILLVPVGALLLAAGVLATLRACGRLKG